MVISLLNAIAAIPALVGYLNQFVQTVLGWYIGRQQSETLAEIADAAALSARAKTDDERFAAAERWQTALSRTRISS